MTFDVDHMVRRAFAPDPDALEFAYERSVLEVRDLVPASDRRIAGRRFTRILVLAAITVALVCGLALAADQVVHGSRDTPPVGDGTGDIARKARHNGAAWIRPDEASSLAQQMEGIPEGIDAPSLSRMTPLADGVVLLDDGDFRIVGVESTTGDLCTMTSWHGREIDAGCGNGLPPSGVGFSWAYGGGGEFLDGPIAGDITRITVITRSGMRSDASIGRGAAAWRGEDGDHPRRIIVEHRAGATLVYNGLDVMNKG
jgi:hypothetical protein